MRSRMGILLASAAALGLGALPAAAQGRGDWGYGYGPWGMMGGGSYWGPMGFGMGIVMLLFWVVVIVGVVMLVRWMISSGHVPSVPAGETAEDILKKRYARGEIDKEEFQEKMRDLRG